MSDLEIADHTQECVAFQQQAQEAHDAYVSRWPNYCRKCGGAGGFLIRNYPSAPDDYEPCTCTESGICPRCGKKVWNEEDMEMLPLTCPECHWDDETTPCCPDVWDGFCGCAGLEGVSIETPGA